MLKIDIKKKIKQNIFIIIKINKLNLPNYKLNT